MHFVLNASSVARYEKIFNIKDMLLKKFVLIFEISAFHNLNILLKNLSNSKKSAIFGSAISS